MHAKILHRLSGLIYARQLAHTLGRAERFFGRMLLLAFTFAIPGGLDAQASPPTTRPATTRPAATRPAATRPARVYVLVTLDVDASGTTTVVASDTVTSVDTLARYAALFAADEAKQRVLATSRPAGAIREHNHERTGSYDPGAALEARARRAVTGEVGYRDSSEAGYPGQCTAEAVSTGSRCRNRAQVGEKRCHIHK